MSAADATAKPQKGKGEPKAAKAEAESTDSLTLQNAVQGAVCTRFPPEASGFIHIGHAKAALVDRMLADKYGGKMILRFDDTNPDKEKHEFEQAILDDLKVLGVTYEVGPTYSSDYMDVYIEKAEQMLKEGTAYCDTTDRETMQKQRYDGIESACRNNSYEENMKLWNEMRDATDLGRSACLRAKISIDNPNKAMRDPVLFRVNTNPHARQGRKYNMYPTYDFCCPIIDSVEGVTHALRTNEYHDRNAQYDWILTALQMRAPQLEDFSRLNMEYAVMSKRKLTQLVEDKVVDGWNDPRFPTIRALVRRGLKIEALKEFVKVQGMSKAVNFMEWSKLWNFNVQVLDPSVPRFTVVSDDLKVKCTIIGGGEQAQCEALTKPKHVKNADLGEKTYYRSNVFYLDAEDVALLADGEQVTLMSWGNAFVKNIQKNDAGVPVSADIELNLAGEVKATKYKLTWIPDLPDKTVPIVCNEYDHLLSKKKPDPEESLEGLISPVTKFTQNVIGEAAMKDLQVGDYMQIERRGYYIVDGVSPLTLIAIPDGKDKVNHLSAKYQYLKTLPAGTAAVAEGDKPKAAVAKSTKADENMSLEEKKALKAAKKQSNAAPEAAAAEASSMSKVSFMIGKVVEVAKHPESEKLYVEKVDLGEATGPRTILSGLQEHVKEEDFLGKLVLVVANLDPRKIGGIPSAGMVLCASSGPNKEKTELLTIPEGTPIGERVVFPGHDQPAEPVLKKKLAKHWEDVAGALVTDANGVATWNDMPFTTSKGPITSNMPNGVVS